MSQTLQNQLLLAKSMNGIITLSDGAGTIITNGQVTTTDLSSNTLQTGNVTLNGVLDLNNSLELEQYDNITTSVGSVSLWEKGNSYFTYLPRSLATPALSSELITKGYGDAEYARVGGVNSFTSLNRFDSVLPTSTLNATSSTQFITRGYADTRYNTIGSYASLTANQTFTGVNDFSNNFSVSCPTVGGSIFFKIGGLNVFEIGRYALYSPLSIAYGSGIDQITFNIPPVFKSNVIFTNGYTIYLGDAYGPGYMEALWGGISITDNAEGPTFFNTNKMEPYSTNPVNLYTTAANSQTVTFGNSASTNALSIQFANTTFNRPITILDNITANSLIVTPTQLSFLNAVSAGKIGQSQISNGYVDLTTNNQTISGLKDFTSSFTGIKELISYPANYTRATAYNNGIMSLGSLALNSLSNAGGTNFSIIGIGNTCLANKTLNTSYTTCIGGSNLNQFTNAAFSYVSIFGSGNVGNPGNYPLTSVSIFGSNTDFNPSGLNNPTAVSNASFYDAPGINLAAAAAVSNVYAICTDQYITGSNQGKIGKTGIPLTIYGDTTINNNLSVTGNVTGTLTLTGALKESSTQSFWVGNFALPSAFTKYNFFSMKTAASFQASLPQSNATTVNKQFILKRIGGSLQILTAVGTAGPEGLTQAIFYGGTSIGQITAGNLVTATQNSATVVSIQTQDTTVTGTFTNTAGATVVTIVTQSSPFSVIVIGGVYNFNGVTRSIISYGTGLGGTGTYNINASIAGANTGAAYTSINTYAWAVVSVS